MTSPSMSTESVEMQQCLNACLDCHVTCIRTIGYCLMRGGEHAEAAHVRTLADCVEMCQTSAHFMLRGSELHPRTCGVCAEVCRRCAESCERMGDDATLRGCATICRRCAESCERMAQAA